jgi:hypothetical protein
MIHDEPLKQDGLFSVGADLAAIGLWLEATPTITELAFLQRAICAMRRYEGTRACPID